MMGWLSLFAGRDSDEPVARECRSCEILQIELDHARREKALLLEALIEKVRPVVELPPSEEEVKNLKPISVGRQHISHRIRNQMIRESDNQLLKLMQDSKREMAEARSAAQEKVSDEPAVSSDAVAKLERNILGVK